MAHPDDAFARLAASRYHVLFTDVSLPGMSGVDLARRIRAVAPAMPLLFASGYADVATFGDELAAETVLKKPYRIGEVAARIGDALSAESTQ